MNRFTLSSNRSIRFLAIGMCLTSIPLFLTATGCQSRNVHDQTAGQRIDDLQTTSRVSTALSSDVIYKFDTVNVETFNGNVQLSGFASSREQAERAAEIARKTPGVRNVINNITLRDAVN
jgi:hyperosmotically inducible periplasmic protein